MNKKLITLTAAAVLSVSVLFGATGLCADKVEDNTKMEGAEFTFVDNEYTFDMFKENLKDDISKENLVKAKTLFKEATKADQDACKAWDELYAMDIFKYSELTDECDVIEKFTFDIFRQDLKNNLSKDMLNKVKSFFDKAITLENENKLDEAANRWDQLYGMDIFNNDVACGEEAYAKFTYDEFKKQLKNDVSKEHLSKAKALFKKAMNLEENNKFDKAKPVWEDLYLMDIYNDEEITCATALTETFDMFKQELKKDVSKEDLAKAKALFEKASRLNQQATEAWDELYNMNIFNDQFGLDSQYTFNMFKEELKDDISKDDLNKAKALFNKAMDYEKNDKYEEAQKVWDELYQLDIFNCCFLDDYSFEQLKEDFKQEVSKNDLNKAESLFEKAMGLEKKGKFEDAKQVWDELYSMDIFGYEMVVDAHSADTK